MNEGTNTGSFEPSYTLTYSNIWPNDPNPPMASIFAFPEQPLSPRDPLAAAVAP
jgi:hypothetical protein